MNIEMNEIQDETLKEKDIDKKISNLLLVTKLMSVISLFGYISVLTTILLSFVSLIIQGNMNITYPLGEYENFSKLCYNYIIILIFAFLGYMFFIVLNHRMIITKNKKLKRMLIIEIILLSILIMIPFIYYLGLF